jgi:hypothetical protein
VGLQRIHCGDQLQPRPHCPLGIVLVGLRIAKLKDEIKRRSLLEAAGDSFAIRVSEQISGRLDVAAGKQHLGDAWRRFEVAMVPTVVRIKAVKPLAAAA